MTPMSKKSSYPRCTIVLTANTVSVSSFSHGSTMVSTSRCGLQCESKSPTISAGFTPSASMCLRPLSQKTIASSALRYCFTRA